MSMRSLKHMMRRAYRLKHPYVDHYHAGPLSLDGWHLSNLQQEARDLYTQAQKIAAWQQQKVELEARQQKFNEALLLEQSRARQQKLSEALLEQTLLEEQSLAQAKRAVRPHMRRVRHVRPEHCSIPEHGSIHKLRWSRLNFMQGYELDVHNHRHNDQKLKHKQRHRHERKRRRNLEHQQDHEHNLTSTHQAEHHRHVRRGSKRNLEHQQDHQHNLTSTHEAEHHRHVHPPAAPPPQSHGSSGWSGHVRTFPATPPQQTVQARSFFECVPCIQTSHDNGLYRVTVDLPGIGKEGISVNLDHAKRMLRVHVAKETEERTINITLPAVLHFSEPSAVFEDTKLTVAFRGSSSMAVPIL